MNTPAIPSPAYWRLLSLRPRGAHGPMRQAARQVGARLIAVSPWRLQQRADPASCAALADALACTRVIFTSPAAVDAAAALAPLAGTPHAPLLAVGAGTAESLRQHGALHVLAPDRMDTEGLLAMPQLADVMGHAIGLVTAPEGRGLLAATLQAAGATVCRADVYERQWLALSPRRLASLRALPARSVLAVSSGAALDHVVAQLPADVAAQWRQRPVVAASDRLLEQAVALGFTACSRAEGPRPLQLAEAAARAVSQVAG